ncbi:hypothetical protein H8D04_00515 [bacterium]|nr:hypothetical protein [bacterium]
MIKLKKLINESLPGFANRKFGDSLPTLSDIMKNHQSVVKEAAPKKYHVGWIIGKKFNEKSALKYAIKLGYGKNANNLYVEKEAPGHFVVWEKA